MSEELPVSLARDLDVERPEQQWLVTDLWGRCAVGLIGGAPKSAKSWLGLDLAVSVASRTPALGRFTVDTSGPALIYLAEDGLPQVRQRIEAICEHRSLDIRRLDVHVITAPSLRLDLGRDQGRLRATVAHLKPRLVLLDPLVRLHRADENSAAEMSVLLSYFRDLQRTFNTAVILVHHASKKNRAQPGQALRGSTDLHAFGDSNAYLARKGDQLILTLEHRAAKPPSPMTLELCSRDDGSATHLEIRGKVITPSADRRPALDERIVAALNETPMTRTALRDELGVNNQRLGRVLFALEQRGDIRKTTGGWTQAPTPTPRRSQCSVPETLGGDARTERLERPPQ